MKKTASGFTLIELITVILILGLLAVAVLPRFGSLQSSARRATLESIAGTMRSTIAIAQSKAYAKGLSRSASNPGGSAQTGYVIETEAGKSEVDWRNLCPESQAEVGDNLTMLDYISVSATDPNLLTQVNNQYTRVGFDLGTNGGGCYVEYDSFGLPDCTVTIVDPNC
ncbi:type II secretion system protein [Marinobacteraceae bacterium S3BR75-40.1]